jgi:hypothetical protein
MISTGSALLQLLALPSLIQEPSSPPWKLLRPHSVPVFLCVLRSVLRGVLGENTNHPKHYPKHYKTLLTKTLVKTLVWNIDFTN